MSWKSFVSAGLLCALVSPAFAQVVDPGPDLTMLRAGTVANNHLDANGNWVWQVVITPDYDLVPDSSGTPVTAELGFTSNREVQGTPTMGSGFDTENPGAKIFGWEPNSTGTVDPATHFDGIKVEPIGNDGTINQVSSSLGGPNVTSGTQQYLVLTVAGPNSANLTSTITVSGAYTTNGRIAQINGMDGPNYLVNNYDDYNGVFTRTAINGDANLDGTVNDSDLSLVLANWEQSPRAWHQGNFNNQTDNTVNDSDLSIVLANWEASGPVGGGAGAGGGGAVPEPATVALLALAGLGLAGLRRRRT